MSDDLTEEAADLPRYLLPPGCSNIQFVHPIDPNHGSPGFEALKPTELEETHFVSPILPEAADFPLPAMVHLPAVVTVAELGGLLGILPFRVLAVLMRLNMFGQLGDYLPFSIAAEVCSKFGVAAEEQT